MPPAGGEDEWEAAVEGCSSDEKPVPASRHPPAESTPAPNKIPASVSCCMDFFAQARKALSERSPFDSDELLASSILTLPSGLSSLVLKHSESRKKHKKSQSESKASKKGSFERNKGPSIWSETEECFRELTLLDIEKLYQLSSLDSLASSSFFQIPVPGNGVWSSSKVGVKVKEVEKVVVRDSDDDPGSVVNKDASRNGIEMHPSSEAMVVEQQHVDGDGEHSGVEKQCAKNLPPSVQDSSGQMLQNVSSVEWVLGSRNKILLTTTRPTKKRKLLGENAGLQRLIFAHSCEGNSNLCHFCSLGDTGDQLNQLVVCSACKMAVHQKCYGIQEDVDASWLCSWCTWNSGEATQLMDSRNDHDRPCVLCPNSGGALKRIHRAGGRNGSSVEFAHLFCSQWIPEVYVEDMRMMEPILNVDEIKETRWKLVCNVCKVRHGTCIRCTDGACRTSFHPVCAREAGHQLEIWGKFGCDDVELRAFCSKHSNQSNGVGSFRHREPKVSHQFASVSPEISLPANRQSQDELNHENEQKITESVEVFDADSEKLEDGGMQEFTLQKFLLNASPNLENGVAREVIDVDPIVGSTSEDWSTPVSINLAPVLKKLIERRKFTVKEVASEFGISPDSLAAAIAAGCLAPELSSKVANWIHDHAYMAPPHRNLTNKLTSSIFSKDDIGVANVSNVVTGNALETIMPVKSVPQRRRMVNDIHIVKDEKTMSSVKDDFGHNDVSAIVLKRQQPDKLKEELILNGNKKDEAEHVMTEDSGAEPSISSCTFISPFKSCNPLDGGAEGCYPSGTNGSSSFRKHEDPAFSSLNIVADSDINMSSTFGSYVVPYIKKRIEEMPSSVTYKLGLESDGGRVHSGSPEEEIPDADCSPHHQNPCAAVDLYDNTNEIGLLNFCPDDDVEEELIYFQHRLLSHTVAQKHISDNLICRVVKNLPEEIDAVRKQRWDDLQLNRYLYEIREARKQGRKERRHREAQAVLAAATAAAAASSRMSSLRKDDELSHQENQLMMEGSRSHGRGHSHIKRATSGLADTTAASDKLSNVSHLTSNFSQEHTRSCDICRRSETLLNPILICSGCKVAVHLGCYHSVKENTGPWFCELCEELSSLGTPHVNLSEKHYLMTECALCGFGNGAFRKSTNGQWVHAFCAEWVFEFTYRQGQTNAVEGMETVMMGGDVCCVCHRGSGVCVKCNYGNCQGTFHPSCGRNADYYMIVRNVAGKLQHKAYCEKHSIEQRMKAKSQKQGAEGLKSLRLIRVELEKLRLLCERIVKREKLKRELVFCSHDILSARRDSVAFSMFIRSPFSSEVSSESATTSLHGPGEGSRSVSDTLQKSDDITVDSRPPIRHRVKLRVSADADQKTDDSSMPQRLPTPKPIDRVTFAGKKIPYKASLAYHNIADSGEKGLKSRKQTETFEKELIMTYDQASMKNRRLPKGFIYVPIEVLEKPVDSAGKGDWDG